MVWGFVLAKNFAFLSVRMGQGPGIAARCRCRRLLRQLWEEEEKRKPHRREEKKKMAQRLSPDRRQGDFPGRNRDPKETPGEPMGSDRGPPVPPLGEAGVGEGRGRRERAAFGSSMGTMGPVSEEPGLSLWDAMSVRGRRGEGRAAATLTVRSEIRLDLRGEETGRDRQQRRSDGHLFRFSVCFLEGCWISLPLFLPSHFQMKNDQRDAEGALRGRGRGV